jgi:hypothetical protein
VIAIGAEEWNFFVPQLLPMTIKIALALRTGHPENFRHGVLLMLEKENSKSELKSETKSKPNIKLDKSKTAAQSCTF